MWANLSNGLGNAGHAQGEQGDLTSGVNIAPESQFDLDGNLVIDQTDIDQWLKEAAEFNGYASPYRSGDTDDLGAVFPNSRDVNITDFNALASNFDPIGANAADNIWENGNFDEDNDIDVTDVNLLATNFAAAGYDVVRTVPEPTGVGGTRVRAAIDGV